MVVLQRIEEHIQVLLEGCESGGLYKLLVSPNACVQSGSIILPVCSSYLASSYSHTQVEVHSRVCNNSSGRPSNSNSPSSKVCKDSDVCDNSPIVSIVLATQFVISQFAISKEPFNSIRKENESDLNNNVGVSLINSTTQGEAAFKYMKSAPRAHTYNVTSVPSSYVSSFAWRERFGHPSSKVLQQVIQCGIPCNDKIGRTHLCMA